MLAVRLSDERNLSSPVCILISFIAPIHNFIQDIFMHLRNVLFHSLVMSQTTHLFFPPSFAPQWQDVPLDLLRGPDLFLCTLNVPAPLSPCRPHSPDEDTLLHSISQYQFSQKPPQRQVHFGFVSIQTGCVPHHMQKTTVEL